MPKKVILKKQKEPQLQEMSFQGNKENIVDMRLKKSYKKMQQRRKK